MQPSSDITRLLEIMAALRDPQTGCPWDVQQSFETILPYTLEEAYEVADAIERQDMDDLRDELGDLLLQVVFHSRMAEEAGFFAFDDVVEAITAKMIRRHPHVFGDARTADGDLAKAQWNRIKTEEKAARLRRRMDRGLSPEYPDGYLSGVPRNIPALMRALKLQQRASKVGFDWGAAEPILAKIEEEIAELRVAMVDGSAVDRTEELGDVLFSVVNLSRHLDVDPELALAGTNTKFERRFHAVEAALTARGSSLDQAGLEEMEAEWQRVKGVEKT